MDRKRTAVVVDDEPITRLDLVQMLEEMGFEVAGDAADGFDAIELCRLHHPDVVLMDIKMPVFDGLTASETIISEDLGGCVVLLTAFRDREFIDRASAIGVTGYLVKPVEERLLLPTLEVAMAQAERLREARREAREMERRMEEQKLIDRAKALLAQREGIGEAEAYRRLQRMAMEKRCGLAVLAATVVAQQSQRELVNRAKERLMQSRGLSEEEAYRQVKELGRRRGGDLAAAAREILSGKGREK